MLYVSHLFAFVLPLFRLFSSAVLKCKMKEYEQSLNLPFSVSELLPVTKRNYEAFSNVFVSALEHYHHGKGKL